MYRILVFSDTHKKLDCVIKTVENIVDVDLILHAGDHAADAEEIAKIFPNMPLKFVGGNCDFGNYPKELIIEAENKKIFLTHGHSYAVKYDYDYDTIFNRGKALSCDCIVFGHTHLPLCEVRHGITLLNPGSAKSSYTYGVIEIENGNLKAAVCPLLFNI